MGSKEFRLWATGCAHMHTDKGRGRLSLVDAITDSEEGGDEGGPPGAIDVWLGGHTHTNPDDTYGGRSHIERRWGVTFINAAALSLYHGAKNTPMSRLLTFVDGSDAINVKCYLHTSHYAPEGWYGSAERSVKLSKPFHQDRHSQAAH